MHDTEIPSTSTPRGRRRRRRSVASSLVASLVGIAGGLTVAAPTSAQLVPPPIGPTIPPVEVPLCERPDAPGFCFADFSAHASSFGAWDSWRHGGPATAFYVTIRNDGLVDPGAVWSTVSIDQYEIIEIEPVWGDHDVESAPVASADSEAVWTIHHRNGLTPDEFTTFRVWVGTWDAVDLAVQANHHAGVEHFGETSPLGYRHREADRSNNLAFTFG